MPGIAAVGPRERYAWSDGAGFGDVELLALVLGTGTASRSTRAIAAELLDTFGDLAGIAAAPVPALGRVHGVGPALAVRVHAACQLGRRARRRPGGPIRTPEQAWCHLRGPMAGLPSEELHGLYLDRAGRLRFHRRLTVGSAGFTIVDPAQVLGPALATGSPALLIAHNHPSGDPEPSEADLACTRRVAEAAAVVGVKLLDHLVIGAMGYVSLAERGLLPAWAEPSVPTTG